MLVKIIQFNDCRAIVTDESVSIPDAKCISSPYVNLMPKESLLEFKCDSRIFSDVCQNKQLLESVIDIYMVKEITTEQLKSLFKK